MICACGRWMPAVGGNVAAQARAEVAEVLTAHQFREGLWLCRCGWSPGTPGWIATNLRHRNHVADALAPLLARREAEARAEVAARVESELAAWEKGIAADVALGIHPRAVEALQRMTRHIRTALAARSDQQDPP